MTNTFSDGLAGFLPGTSSSTTQAVIVDAEPSATFAAIRTTDLADSPAVSLLATRRMLPDRLVSRLRARPTRPALHRATLVDLIDSGYWVVLVDDPPRELVLGLVMWDERMAREGASRELFADPGPGAVRVGWSFVVEPLGAERSLLITETRTQPTDAVARSRFRLYWAVVSPFAALTRRLVLRAIRSQAETRQAAHRTATTGRATVPA